VESGLDAIALRNFRCAHFRRSLLYCCALHQTRIIQIHAGSRAIQHTSICAQAVQSGTAGSKVFQVREP
jgi:hypothetical protein